MAKALTKTAFGVPSADVLTAIDASDKCAELQAASYRFTAKLAELERQFEAKASELRTAYLEESRRYRPRRCRVDQAPAGEKEKPPADLATSQTGAKEITRMYAIAISEKPSNWPPAPGVAISARLRAEIPTPRPRAGSALPEGHDAAR
jgi:hypothetical protein